MIAKFAFAALLLAVCSAHVLSHLEHNCIHDDIEHNIEVHHEHIEKEATAKRDLAGETWEPFRIVANYDNFTGLSAEQTTYIRDKLMPEVINYLNTALKVNKVVNPLTFPAGNCNTAKIPASMTTGSAGVAADLALLITALPADAGTIAWASSCRLGTDGRPILGQVNFNPQYVNANASAHQGNVATVQHEITHILAFSGSLYNYWKTGAPIGKSVVTTPITNRGTNGRALNTSRIVKTGRTYFNCSSLVGVEIENEGASGSLGSHWERRILGNEAMTASAVANAKFSFFTFALLEDSGWYQADYSKAAILDFGRGAGCDFINKPCIDNVTKKANFPEYCSNLNAPTCPLDGYSTGVCATVRSFAPVYNYFGDGTVGLDTFGDECPAVLPYSNGDCRDTTRNPPTYYGEKLSASSRCFSGTVLASGYAQSNKIRTFCYPTNCTVVNDTTRLSVTIGSKTYDCPLGGGNITNLTGYSGYVTCPSEKYYCVTPGALVNPNTIAVHTEETAGNRPDDVPQLANSTDANSTKTNSTNSTNSTSNTTINNTNSNQTVGSDGNKTNSTTKFSGRIECGIILAAVLSLIALF